MMKQIRYGAWLIARHLVVAGIAVLLFPLATAAFYVVTSIAGGHTGDDKGDLVLVLPLAGAAFVIACVFVFFMLVPAMLVCDGVRIASGTSRRKTLVVGLIIVSLLYLPWQLRAPDGFSAKGYLVGTTIIGVVFSVYWSVCQVVDVIAEKLYLGLRKRINTRKGNGGEVRLGRASPSSERCENRSRD